MYINGTSCLPQPVCVAARGQCLLSSDRFDPTLNTWSPLPDMNERRVEGGWENMGVSVGALEPWISILLGWSSRVWSSFTFFVQGLVNVLSCGILNITLKYLLEISSIPSNYGWCSIQRFTWFTTPCCWNTWTTSSSSDSRFSNGESPGDLVRPRWPWWYEDHQPGWVPLHFASNRGAGLVFYLSSFTCC